MKKLILRLVCVLGSLIAFSSVAGACALWTYQPEVPQELVSK